MPDEFGFTIILRLITYYLTFKAVFSLFAVTNNAIHTICIHINLYFV